MKHPQILRKIAVTLWLLLSFCVANAQNERFIIQGTAAEYEGQTAQLVRFTATGIDQLATDTVENGKFRLGCLVEETISGVVRIGDAFNGAVILEPTTLEMRIKEDNSYQIKGGYYNPVLLGYLETPEYIDTDHRFRVLTDGGNPATVKGTDDEWEMVELFLKKEELRSQYLDSLFKHNTDPVIKTLAAIMNELQPNREETIDAINEIADQVGEQSIKMQRIRAMDKQQVEALERRHSGMLGEEYIDFTVSDLEGQRLQLEPIIKQHKYTLLQFWASWCGPCRKEIPLLKTLYNDFHSKGLEIVSFSLDDNRNNWIKASEIEQLEWYNVSDLRAFESSVVKSYPVFGIPANVIIDAEGKIIASNLTGEDLESKIKTLFQ